MMKPKPLSLTTFLIVPNTRSLPKKNAARLELTTLTI
jgi:hypothetical protein